MADHTRPESADVEHIMRQIRTRIAARRGTDPVEPQVQQLAAARLEAILDPRRLRPELLEQLQRGRPAAPPPPMAAAYTFEDTTLFESTRGPLRWIRRLLLPILKLFFNPNPLIQALHLQARINTEAAERDTRRDQLQAEWNAVYYEVIRTLVDEVSRNTLEVRALRLKLDSLQGRLDFAERRARSLEGALQPRGGRGPRNEPRDVRERDREVRPEPQPRAPVAAEPEVRAPVAAPDGPAVADAVAVGGATESFDARRRRRRRRRGRRGGGGLPGGPAVETAGGALADDDGDDASGPAPRDHAAADSQTERPDPVAPVTAGNGDREPSAQ